MAQLISIPASRIVRVTPSAIQAGNSNFVLNGAILTPRALIPIKSYSSATEVAKDYGDKDKMTELATIYFAGIKGATKLPEKLIISQLKTKPTPPALIGGSLRGMSIDEFRQLRGSLAIDVNNQTRTGNFDFSTAVSFSSGASMLSEVLEIDVEFNTALQAFVFYVPEDNSGGGQIDGDIKV